MRSAPSPPPPTVCGMSTTSGLLELDRYDGLMSAATTRVRRAAEAMLLDAVIEALITFAAEYPEAPRP